MIGKTISGLAQHEKLSELEEKDEHILDDIEAGKWDTMLADKSIKNHAEHIVNRVLNPTQQPDQPATQSTQDPAATQSTDDPASQSATPEGVEEKKRKKKPKKKSSLSEMNLPFVSILNYYII